MGRRASILTMMTTALSLLALPGWACGFLIAENGAIRLGRTATLAAYVDGVEHYVTSFEYQGGVDSFGSIIPLPDVPTTVEKAGGWTLQRLQREVDPPPPFDPRAFAVDQVGTAEGAQVLMQVEVEALDIVVLRGGAQDVLDWANDNGFDLPADDALPMLEFYASRSPVFLAARYDVDRAQQLERRAGDGTPIHVVIPTDDPWVPLSILGFAKPEQEIVDADVFLLTPQRPTLAPGPHDGLKLEHSAWASDDLLDDLRDDENSGWIPERAWLSYLRVQEEAGDLTYDLAIDADGSEPSWVDAALEPAGAFVPISTREDLAPDRTGAVIVAAAIALAGAVLLGRRPRGQRSVTRARQVPSASTSARMASPTVEDASSREDVAAGSSATSR